MIVTIPRFGNTYLAAKVLFETLQIPCIIPQESNKRTLQTGVYLSPEEICLPFKIMMGNYIECIKKGADTIITIGSCGPCRFGEYCELQKKLLDRLGYKINVIVIDAPSEIGKDAFWQRIGMISNASGLSKGKKICALTQAVNILRIADRIDAKAHYLTGYEIVKGECKRLLLECKYVASQCDNAAAMRMLLKEYDRKLNSVKINPDRNPIKIVLIGEIFTMVEPFGNLFLEDRLMDYGVSSIRHITPSWWIKDLVLKPIHLNSPQVKRLSRQYLPFSVGGHARESVAHVLHAKSKKMDGAIQVFPMGCMPEIITKAVLPTIQKGNYFPIMSLIVDEMTGEAGYSTRIEAFIDMLEAKRKRVVNAS